MQTPQSHPTAARTNFRLPLARASCRYNLRGGIEGESADGAYSLRLAPSHGVLNCKAQFWAWEQRTDEAGRSWTCTTAQFAVDDFGDLVEVAA